MQCNCLVETKEKIKAEQPWKNKGLTIDRVRYPEETFILGTDMAPGSRLAVRLELECFERKKPVIQNIIPQYCPFCGKKQIKEQEKEVSDES